MIPLALVASVACQAPATESPATAPDFALPDLQGTVHRLADVRGKIVVLEWLSNRCPTVAYHYEKGIAHETRTKLRGDDLVYRCC